jgi:hypothetical protein
LAGRCDAWIEDFLDPRWALLSGAG